jgi:hypothetical protein
MVQIFWLRSGVRALLCLLNTSTTAAAILSLDIGQDSPSQWTQRRYSKRDTVPITLENQITSYYTNVTLGSPGQSVTLSLVINAADTWVNLANSSFCSQSKNDCSTYGTYDPKSSSSYTFVKNGFSLRYADGGGAQGYYIKETFALGGHNVTDVQLGMAQVTYQNYGILGLGFAAQEVDVIQNHAAPYANFPQTLANSGVINSNAYSLWLNDLLASTGNIIFGGVDTEKFTGELRTIPIVTQQSSTADLIVPLTGLRLGDTVLLQDENLNVTLDTGISLTYLPDDITTTLYEKLGAQYNTNDGYAVINCSQADNDITLDFTLSWPVVNVTMRELVIPAAAEHGQPVCMFGVAPSSANDNMSTLGITFLRSAYVVYNLANNELSIAQTKFNTTSSNVVEIMNNVNGVPGAVRAPSVAPTPSATAHSTTHTSGGATDIAHTQSNSSSNNSLSPGAKGGIGVGVVVGVGLIGAFIFFWLRRRRHSGSTTAAVDRNNEPELVETT